MQPLFVTPPIEARVSIARVYAGLLTVYGIVTGVATLVSPGPLGDDAILLATPPLLAYVWVAAGGIGRLQRSTTREVALGVVALLGLVGALGVYATAPTEFPEALVTLPLLLLGSALTLHVRVHLAVTFLTGAAAAVITSTIPDTTAQAYFPTLVAVASGLLAALATSVLARALRTAEEDRALAARATGAMQAVVTAANASAGVSNDLDDVLGVIATAIGAIGADIGSIALLDEDQRTFHHRASYRMSAEIAEARWSSDEGLFGAVVAQGRTVVVDDYSASDLAVGKLREQGIRAAVGVPIHDQGELVGALVAGRYDAEPAGPSGISALELLAEHAGRAIALSRRLGDERRTLQRLQRLNERQTDFVATVSHELRTPVTIVDGLVTTLRTHHDSLDEDARALLLERIAANTSSLSTIVTTLLDTARLDGGQVPEDERVDIGALVLGCVDRLAPLLVDHDVRVDVTDGVEVRGDRGLLERVVENLLTNAERYTPAGTAVEVTVATAAGRAVVAVVDHGPGVPPDVLPSITQRFVRGGDHRTRGTRGLGIGLALADQMLRLHDGRLEVSRTPGGGATFTFALRLAGRSERQVIEPGPGA